MSQVLKHIANEQVNIQERPFLPLLEELGLNVRPDGHFLYVGLHPTGTRWQFHLSIIAVQIASILDRVAPFLAEMSVGFRVARNKGIANNLLCGKYGAHLLARVITIYPQDDREFIELANKLPKLTMGFKGPAIPFTLPMGGLLYLEFTGREAFLPKFWPLPTPIPQQVDVNPPKVFKNTYRIVKVLKPDVKGNVYQGVYLKGFMRVSKCIIKEGCRYMWTDDAEQDICDRLRWQAAVQRELKGVVNVPKVVDVFEENGRTYLVMECVKGEPLSMVAGNIFKGRLWSELSLKEQLKLISYLLRIVDIVGKLHSLGYVHRDLTPVNFMVDKRDRIFLIDLELAYNIKTDSPGFPFGLGTKGFISLEQCEYRTPTAREDIFGFGGMMIALFTNLMPIKFFREDLALLSRNLDCFIHDWQMAGIIAACFHRNPEERPEFKTLETELSAFSKRLKNNSTAGNEQHTLKKPSLDTIHNLIACTWRAITMVEVTTETSMVLQRQGIYMDRLALADPMISPNNIMGTMLHYSEMAHYGLFGQDEQFQADVKVKVNNILSIVPEQLSPSLVNGAAMVALALTYAAASGIISDVERVSEYLIKCFQRTGTGYHVSTGVAGQALALLHCSGHVPTSFAKFKLQEFTDIILAGQQKDGSWPLFYDKEHKAIATGLFNGVAGIVYYLLDYHSRFPSDQIEQAIRPGLKWLKDQAYGKNGVFGWSTESRRKEKLDGTFFNGTPGIVFTFLKGYEVLKEDEYRTVAGKALAVLPQTLVTPDYSLDTGAAGWGVLYLYAYKITGNTEWLNRAEQVAALLHLTYIQPETDRGYFEVTGKGHFPTGFPSGNLGMLYFLIEYYKFRKQSEN